VAILRCLLKGIIKAIAYVTIALSEDSSIARWWLEARRQIRNSLECNSTDNSACVSNRSPPLSVPEPIAMQAFGSLE
jgi:hypothetical protein